MATDRGLDYDNTSTLFYHMTTDTGLYYDNTSTLIYHMPTDTGLYYVINNVRIVVDSLKDPVQIQNLEIKRNISCSVDICGIVERYCVNFPFIIKYSCIVYITISYFKGVIVDLIMVVILCIVKTMTQITVYLSTTCVTVMLNVKMALMKIQNFVEVRQHSSLNTILSYLFFLDPFALWIPKPFKSFSFPFFLL